MVTSPRALFAALCALALTTSGCDLLDSGDDGLSGDDLDRLENLVDCNDVEAVDLNDTVTGDLDGGDCTLEELTNGSDLSLADFYAFRVEDDNVDIEIEMEGESGDIDPYLYLIDDDGDVIASDDDGGGGTDARITDTVDSGIYIVVANTVADGQEGEYTLRIRD